MDGVDKILDAVIEKVRSKIQKRYPSNGFRLIFTVWMDYRYFRVLNGKLNRRERVKFISTDGYIADEIELGLDLIPQDY